MLSGVQAGAGIQQRVLKRTLNSHRIFLIEYCPVIAFDSDCHSSRRKQRGE